MRLGFPLLALPFALACEPELAPSPEYRSGAEYERASVPSASGPLGPGSWPQPREPPKQLSASEATHQTIFAIFRQALDQKVGCPKAEAWVSRLNRKSRTDGWGALVVAECTTEDLILRSFGKDGVRGNSDDVRVSLETYAFWPPGAWPRSDRKRPR